MEQTQINNVNAISNTLELIAEKHAEYLKLHNDYMRLMQTSGAYEINPDYVVKDGDFFTPAEAMKNVLHPVESGITDKGIKSYVTAGKIRKIEVKKPDELVKIESELTGLLKDYDKYTVGAVSRYQITATKTRGTTVTGEIGKEQKEKLIGIANALLPGIVVEFNGRRVSGSLPSGKKIKECDAYAKVYDDVNFPPGTFAFERNISTALES